MNRLKIVLILGIALWGSPLAKASENDFFDYERGRFVIISEEEHTVELMYTLNDTIPDSVVYNDQVYTVTSIGEGAFNERFYLNYIKIPNSVKIIKRGAFFNCKDLSEVDFGDSIEIIESSAFSYTNLSGTINLKPSLKYIGTGVFSNTNISTINIPEGLTEIEPGAFSYPFPPITVNIDFRNPFYCCIDGAIYDKGVTTLISSTGPVTTLKIPEIVTTIADNACQWSLISDIDFPESVLSIGKYSFEGTEITDLVLPPNLESLGRSSFESCKNLKTITIPASLDYIPDNFRRCESLKSVTCLSPIPITCEGFSVYRLYACTLFVPETSIPLYKIAKTWEFFGKICAISNSVETPDFTENVLKYHVFDLNGIKLLTTSNYDDILSLPKGIYIINGKKTVL